MADAYAPPVYSYSDYLEVGYALPWIRAPQELYNLPFTYFEGVDALYNFSLANWDFTLQPFYALFKATVVGDGTQLNIDARNFAGFNFMANHDWLSLRTAYFQDDAKINTPADGLFNTLRGAGFDTAVNELAFNSNKVIREYNLGAKIDYNDWLVSGETSYNTFDSAFLPDRVAWSLTAARRINKFTPYYTYAEVKCYPPVNALGSIADPGLRAATDGLLQAVRVDSHSHLFGVRWDFMRNTALKVEWQNLHDDLPYPAAKRSGNLFSFAVDVVF